MSKTTMKKSKTAAQTTPRDALRAVLADLGSVLLEREEELQTLGLSLLCGLHAFFLGVPGVAKTLMIDELALRLKGAQYFSYLMTRFTDPAEVFGMLDMDALLNRSECTRNTSGMMQECHIAFLDEMWKSSSAIANSFLTILNEGIVREGGKVTRVPLMSMFCASNEMPHDQGDDLGAIFDRMTFRHVVSPLTEGGVRAMLKTPPRTGDPQAFITLAQLEQARAEVRNVTVQDSTIETYLAIRRELATVKGVYVSDRKNNAAMKVAQASAWLAGRDKTENEDLLPLVNVLWDDPEHRAAVEIAVVKVAAPALRALLKLEDAAVELSKTYNASDDENVRTESLMKLKACAEKARKKSKRAGEKGRRIADKLAQLAQDAIDANKRRMAKLYGAEDLFEEV